MQTDSMVGGRQSGAPGQIRTADLLVRSQTQPRSFAVSHSLLVAFVRVAKQEPRCEALIDGVIDGAVVNRLSLLASVASTLGDRHKLR